MNSRLSIFLAHHGNDNTCVKILHLWAKNHIVIEKSEQIFITPRPLPALDLICPFSPPYPHYPTTTMDYNPVHSSFTQFLRCPLHPHMGSRFCTRPMEILCIRVSKNNGRWQATIKIEYTIKGTIKLFLNYVINRAC